MYRAGLAGTQDAYEQAVTDVFECLDELEARLVDRPFLHGETVTETDWRVFVTLIRFDPAYHGLFRCNVRRLLDYPRLSRYTETVV